MVIVLSTSAGFVIAAGYAQEHRFPVKGVVVDPSGRFFCPGPQLALCGNRES
jgi:hypothetical protein